MTGYRRPRRANTTQVVIVFAVYAVALLAITLAWNYRDVWRWWS